jgi:hypothetical protein
MNVCPVCGSSNIKPNHANILSAPYMQTELNGEIIYMATASKYSRCNMCGLVIQDNMKSQEWYDWFYSSGTYRKTLGLTDEEMNLDERARASELVDFLSSNNVQIHSHKDYGSSRGYFLNKTHERFKCQITGDEPLSDYGLMTYDDMPDKPDLVSAIHVLEHVVNPVAKLQSMAKETLRYLLVEVPGEHCIGGALRFAHLHYFPPDTLRAMIETCGLKVVAMDTEPNTRILAEKLGT